MLKIRRFLHSGLLACLIAAAAFLPCSLPSQAAEATAVSLQVPAKAYTKSSYAVPVTISQVSGLNAADFRLTYDPSLITIDEATDGSIGGIPFEVTGFNVVQPGICNVLCFNYNADTLSGSGTLAVIRLHTLNQAGTAQIQLSNGTLSVITTDSTDKPNPPTAAEATWSNASLSIKNKSASSGGSGGGYVPPIIQATPTPTPSATPAVPVTSPTPTPTPEVPVAPPASPIVTPAVPVTTTPAASPASPVIVEPASPPSGTAAAIEKTATVTVTTQVPAPQPEQPSNWWWIILLIAAAAVLIAVISLTVLRKRSAKN
jgi:hypothetical protein